MSKSADWQPAAQPGRYRFGGFEVDRDSLELRDDRGSLVDIPPQAFDLLVYLIEHRDRIVSKDELFQKLWGGVVVSENSLAQGVWAARRAVRDTGGTQRVIKNVRGRGYRFVAEILAESPPQAAAPQSQPPPVADPPSASDAPRRRSSHAAPAPLIGRRAEQARLSTLLDGLSAGHGGVCLISGRAGAGKTRLIEELRAAARERNAPTYTGHSHDDAAMPPFWPWQQAARALIGELHSEDVAELAGKLAGDLHKLIPELEECLPELRRAPERDSSDNRYQLFDAVCELFERAAHRRGPLVIALEDLHWADEASRKLLDFAVQVLPRAPVLLVGSFRDEEVSEELRALAGRALKRACSEHIEVGGLDAQGVGALLEQSLGREPSQGLVERVCRLTAGNPFFVKQLAGLIAAGADDERALPEEARGVLRHRLHALAEPCRALLEAAAVLGQDLHIADLRRVAGHTPEQLVELLGQACDANVLEEAPDSFGGFRFSHPSIRETLLMDIPRSRRLSLHRRVADALVDACADDPGARVDEIAAHYYEAALAGAAGPAVRYGMCAAERAFEATAYEEATAHYRRTLHALDMLDDKDERLRCRLLIGLGHAVMAASADPVEARTHFGRAAELAGELGDMELLAEATAAYAGRGALRAAVLREVGTLDAREIELLERALCAVGDEPSRPRAIVCGWLAHALYNSSETERREALAEEAVAIARTLDDPRLLAEAMLCRQASVRGPAHLDARIASLEELIALTRREGLKGVQLDAHAERAWALFERGETDAAEREVNAARRLAEELSEDTSRRRWTDAFDMMRAGAAGRLDEVEERLKQRAQRHRGPRVDQGAAIYWFFTALLRDRGDVLPQLEAYAERFPLTVAWRCGLSNAYATMQRFDDARRELSKLSTGGFAAVSDDHNYLNSHALIVNACYRLPDPPVEYADALYDKLEPYAGRVTVYGIAGPTGGSFQLVLAQLATMRADPERAEAHFRRAIETNRRIGAPLWEAYAMLDWAKMRIVLGRHGEPAARELIERARSFAVAHGVQQLVRRADQLVA